MNQDQVNGMQMDLEKLTVQNNNYLKEIKDLQEEVSNLNINEISLYKENKQNKVQIESLNTQIERNAIQIESKLLKCANQMERKLNKKERRIVALETSYSFRIGQVFVNAFFTPGKNTLLFPFQLIGILSKAILGKISKNYK